MFGADATRKPSNGKREAFRTFAGGPADALAGVVDAIAMPMTMPLSMLQHAAGRHEPFAPFAALAERVVPQPETLRGKATRFGINMAIPVPAATKGVKAMQGVEDVAAAVAKAGRGVRPAAVADDVAKAVVKARAPTPAAPPPKPAPPIVAYHGSPHKFDQFSLDKIGSGEGAQVYGHGLYFAENEGTAQAYRKSLAGPRPDFDGRVDPELMRELESVDYLGFDNPAGALSGMRQYADWAERWDVAPEQAARIKPLLEAQDARKYAGQGHMYEVGINADPEDFIDWDAPFEAQSPKVRQILEANGYSAPDQRLSPEHRAFGYGAGKELRRPTEVQALAEAGIPGVKYLDQVSRGLGEGTRNYVVFNDKLVDIMKRYGVAAPVAAAILAGQMAPDQAQAAEAPQP